MSFKKLSSLILILSSMSFAVELLPEDINSRCEELTFNKEIRIFKDPEPFREVLKMLATDKESVRNYLLEDSPLLTTRKGRLKICYGEAQPFRSYKKLLAYYPKELQLPLSTKDEIPNILMVRFWDGSDAYFNNLGFVFASEFRHALDEASEGSTPPSLKIIPKIKTK